MQGTVWAGLMCTCTMDKMGKQAYNNDRFLYKYRNKVPVPPLQMVDDVIMPNKCGNNVIVNNTTVNTFTKLKKLSLSEAKCSRLHIGKFKCDQCPKIQVNGANIKETQKEKYLGDFITNNANPKATIQDRKRKGYGILSELKAILTEIPLGPKRCEIGLTLRQAWFINGCLFNSEVWYSLNKSDLRDLEILDHKILRTILGAHSKVPTEQLYLETGSLPISHEITVRRLSYLQIILKKHENEIVRKVYTAQKEEACKGDWVKLVESDFKKLNIDLTDEAISSMSKSEYKNIIKKKVEKHAFVALTNQQSKHKKVKHIEYNNLSAPQQYLLNSKFTYTLSSLLFNLRCESVNNIKANFHKTYNEDINCPLCNTDIDTQQHILKCSKLISKLSTKEKNTLETVTYTHIFGNVNEQYNVTRMFKTMFSI